MKEFGGKDVSGRFKLITENCIKIGGKAAAFTGDDATCATAQNMAFVSPDRVGKNNGSAIK